MFKMLNTEPVDSKFMKLNLLPRFTKIHGKTLCLFFPFLLILVLVTGCGSKETAISPQDLQPPPPPRGIQGSVGRFPAPDRSLTFVTEPDERFVTEAENEFFVVAYNVENLFDIDGVALFNDYKPDVYHPEMLLKKLSAITRTLGKFQKGKGPEIVLFQEFEADQTPSSVPIDYDLVLQRYANTTLQSMLSEPISEDVRDLPAEVFLLKALYDSGLGPYEVALGEYRVDPSGRTVAHINVTFSRFPIVESRTHHSPGARGTLEVVHQIQDHRFHTFNSHWKSGASNQETELIRLENAAVLRNRIDQLLEEDPHVDFVLGGDFNSYYNQSQLFPEMEKTAVNDVLGSQGNEQSIQLLDGPILYNLWYELPPEQRKSDAYRGKWGTLMQMMIPRGLYDYRGIQYVDNSFRVAIFENFNAQPGSLAPLSWTAVNGTGTGVSDHFPITARFRIVTDDDPETFIQLENPSSENPEIDTVPVLVDYSQVPEQLVRKTREMGSDQAIQKVEYIGHVFRVEATVSDEKPFKIRLFEDEFKVWAFDLDLRMEIYRKFPVDSKMEFYGELGFHDGMWQFIVRDSAWLNLESSN